MSRLVALRIRADLATPRIPGENDEMSPKMLLLETSQRVGLVAVAQGQMVLSERRLEEARRHARDLVPICRELLAAQDWKARDLDAVVVSRGPGSYTGLRVGVMSAKTLAYATGCALIGIDSFHAIAQQAPAEAAVLDVIEDAQQDRVYAQRFACDAAGCRPINGLRVLPFDDWREELPANGFVAGPALQTFSERLPESVQALPRDLWRPSAASLLQLALVRHRKGERDNPFTLEPLYLRPSQAEQQWKK